MRGSRCHSGSCRILLKVLLSHCPLSFLFFLSPLLFFCLLLHLLLLHLEFLFELLMDSFDQLLPFVYTEQYVIIDPMLKLSKIGGSTLRELPMSHHEPVHNEVVGCPLDNFLIQVGHQ